MNWLKNRVKTLGVSWCVVMVILIGMVTYFDIPCFTRISKTLYFEKTIATESLNLTYNYGEEEFTAEKDVKIYVNPENPKDYILGSTISTDWIMAVLYLFTIGFSVLFFSFHNPEAEKENDTVEIKQKE